MEPFEIKNLFSIKGHPGVYLFKAPSAINGKAVFARLTDPSKKVLVTYKDVMQFGNVGIYIKGKEEPNTLESVIETLYAMADQGIEIPADLNNLGDRWENAAALMAEVIPGYDEERFKTYHMEKILKWYQDIAKALDMIDEEYDDPYKNETETETEKQ